MEGLNPTEFTKLSDSEYSFTMPSKDINVSCLVNSDSGKVIVVGALDSYFVRNDKDLHITFGVPSPTDGYVYSSGELNVPVRASGYNCSGMTAVMNGESYSISGGNITGTGTEINIGGNVLTLSSTNTNGVDYYSYIGGWDGSRYDYPTKASNLSTLTLTKKLYAQAEKLTADNISSAAQNKDAIGWYVENLPVSGSLNNLKWELTFKDGSKAQKTANLPGIKGEFDISFGIILHGGLDTYTTSDIDQVTITE